ncbi:Cof-type HAD-IIB family hydrolase [Evansella sp. AB-rgal1]|uniref:Cof-type HAD-IIB family hydrolase n=1 Tax=Evansella sp. AB-rgal1 TaxID=3242696 RepID=UPI00359EC09D
MKEIKLVALDMDGTLLNSEHAISEANRKAIKAAQEKGVHIVISTGRSIHTCRKHAESLNLSSYVVTVNGSEIWDSEWNLIEQNTIPEEHMKLMWELKEKHNTNYWAISSEKVWNDEFPFDDLSSHTWLKFGFHVEDDEAREEIRRLLSNHPELEVSNSSLINLEINAIGINKANGLRKVCDKLGITLDNVLAVGDSLNDYAMIVESGVGVAMGNAQEKVKEVADWVTDTNDEDGVAKAIEKFVL